MPTTIAPTTATRRRKGQHKARVTAFMPARSELAHVLARLEPDVERVYLVGERPGLDAAGGRLWAAGVPHGWQQHERGHWLDDRYPVFKYRQGERVVEIHRAAAWLGEGDYTVEQARAAMGQVGELVERHFNMPLLATPATTGRWLMLGLLPAGDWPVLSDEHQELIRSTSGQGRMEVVGHSCPGECCPALRDDAELPALVEYDGRLMYAALANELGRGPVTHDHGNTFEGHRRGRYRVRFTVPFRWPHVGILPVAHDGGRSWHYPHASLYQAETWADGVEIALAVRAGWEVQILERLLLADEHPRSRPLDAWARQLVKVREGIPAEAGTVPTLARLAVRSILLHAIGALHGRPQRRTKMLPIERAGQVPRGAEGVHTEGDYIVWHETAGRQWGELSHPEWSSAIWARARARLLSGPGHVGALHCRPRTIVAFRLDALYLTSRHKFPDDGRAGRLREVRYVTGPLPQPNSHRQLLEVRDGATRP